jgi:hypothetical protein
MIRRIALAGLCLLTVWSLNGSPLVPIWLLGRWAFLPIVVLAVLAFGGLLLFWINGPTLERWSEEAYGEVDDQ